ncbi:MAG TPA: hypothetical protein VF168_06060 [Trueperaceae bacterium]
MPSYPFILLAAIFLLVVIVPPLVAAYIDQQREARRGSDAEASASEQIDDKARRDGQRG